MRILWAEAIDEYRTAMVIDTGGSYMGGVVWMNSMEIHIAPLREIYGINRESFFGARDNATMDIKLVWEWWKYVDSVDVMKNNRDWDKPKQIENVKQLEHKAS